MRRCLFRKNCPFFVLVSLFSVAEFFTLCVWHDLPVTLAKVIALLLSSATTDSGLMAKAFRFRGGLTQVVNLEWSINPGQSFQSLLRPPASLADQDVNEALRFFP